VSLTAAKCDALPIRATCRNLSVFKIATESAESELTVGTHHANVCVGSNAPLRPLVAVPITQHHAFASHTNTDRNTNGNAYCYSYWNSNSNADTECYTDSDGYTDDYAKAHANAKARTDAKASSVTAAETVSVLFR
jgi:hypothetical protein